MLILAKNGLNYKLGEPIWILLWFQQWFLYLYVQENDKWTENFQYSTRRKV